MTLPLFVDGSTPLNAATLNQLLALGEGNKVGAHVVYARLRYTGAAWEVHSTTDSAVLVTGHLSWLTNHLNVSLANFTVAMPPLVAPVFLATGIYLPCVLGASNTQAQIGWFDFAGTLVTTPDTRMDVNFWALGV